MKPWPKIDPGEMVHRVTILEEQTAPDISGEACNYVPILTTWAAIDPVSGLELLQAGQDITQLIVNVRIRWQDGIKQNMQVQRRDGRTYSIKTITNPGERNVILELLCLGLGANE